MRAMFGEGAEDVVEGMWREVYRLDEKLSERALEALKERKWALHTIDEDARIVAEKLPRYREYVERLERIAALLKAAAKELVEEAEREGKYGIVEARDRWYPAYEGPAELSVRVEHVTRGSKKYAVIEAKYGDRTARVELEVEKYWRSALLTNLAAIMTDDIRDFYKGRVLHNTASRLQASERLMTWALFMPGEYKITVRHVRNTKKGLSPHIVISSRFGRGGLAKIEKSPIHRLVLKLAKELAGGENLKRTENATRYVLAASWLLASAILNAPEGGRPSEGLAALAKKGVLPGITFDRLRPIFEELDEVLGSISRVDKAQLVGKMVDYDGYIKEGLLLVKAKTIKKISIELDGVKINMADVAEAAAKAFWKEGGWSGNQLSFGPAKDVPELKVDEEAPLKIPAFKAIAALITKEMQEEADRRRRKELVEYVELYRYKVNELEVKIMAAKAREELTPIARKNLEETWKEFKGRKYTHLRLIVRGEEYELLSLVEDKSAGRIDVLFRIKGEKAQKLAEALKGLGLKDVKPTPGGYFRLSREDLEALLDKGLEAYAVKKAKRGEAMWRVKITYKGVTIELKMTYDERLNRLQKGSSTGKIEVFVYEEGATKGEWVKLDLDLLAAIREGQDCGNCLEKQLAEVSNAIAFENPGFRWSMTGERVKHLYVYLPGDFKDAVRRFYSNT